MKGRAINYIMLPQVVIVGVAGTPTTSKWKQITRCTMQLGSVCHKVTQFITCWSDFFMLFFVHADNW